MPNPVAETKAPAGVHKRSWYRQIYFWVLVGIVLGIVVSLTARVALAHRFPLVQVVVDGRWMVYATFISIAGALAGALYPAFKAAQKDPIDALAYE